MMNSVYLELIYLAFICQNAINAQVKPWIEISIPWTIQVNQEIVSPPKGWQTRISEKKFALADVAIYDGKPDQLATLEPDKDKIDKQTKIGESYYRLAPTTIEGNWIACSYDATNIQLCIQIPIIAQEARITYSNKIPNNTKIMKIEYR